MFLTPTNICQQSSSFESSQLWKGKASRAHKYVPRNWRRQRLMLHSETIKSISSRGKIKPRSSGCTEWAFQKVFWFILGDILKANEQTLQNGNEKLVEMVRPKASWNFYECKWNFWITELLEIVVKAIVWIFYVVLLSVVFLKFPDYVKLWSFFVTQETSRNKKTCSAILRKGLLSRFKCCSRRLMKPLRVNQVVNQSSFKLRSICNWRFSEELKLPRGDSS